MTPNYEPLFYWIREREFIRLRKERGDAPPYGSGDTILATYRFCNVRREDDRVTIWIRDNIRERYANHLWLMLCIARQINWPDTLAELMAAPRGGGSAWPHDEQFLTSVMTTTAKREARRSTPAHT
jgi:5-hmdU DNA kinase, helical domain